MAENNILAGMIGIMVTAVLGFILSRLSSGSDARTRAEGEFMGMMPKIVAELNSQIAGLRGDNTAIRNEMNQLWIREAECQRNLRAATARIGNLEKRVDDSLD